MAQGVACVAFGAPAPVGGREYEALAPSQLELYGWNWAWLKLIDPRCRLGHCVIGQIEDIQLRPQPDAVLSFRCTDSKKVRYRAVVMTAGYTYFTLDRA